MCFIFIRGRSAVAEAPAGARLAPGQRLAWADLPPDSCFVVPLPNVPADGPAAPAGALAAAGHPR
jgi:hypothetical protein